MAYHRRNIVPGKTFSRTTEGISVRLIALVSNVVREPRLFQGPALTIIERPRDIVIISSTSAFVAVFHAQLMCS